MLKRVLLILLVLATALSLASCGERELRTSELVLSLPRDFRELKSDGKADLIVSDGVMSISVTRFSFMNPDIPPSLSADDFASYFLEKTQGSGSVYHYSDVPYYTYSYDSDGIELLCTATFFASPYAYFLVLFSYPSAKGTEYGEKIFEYTDGISFDLS